jgi:hypothetical protein
MSMVAIELTRFTELRRRLLELHPELDDQTLADTLDGATNLREALSALVRSALVDEAMVEGLKQLQEKMKYRLARLEARALAKRQVVLEAMEQADWSKLQEPDFTASLRGAAPSLVILNEAKIPTEFLIAQAPKIDRRGLLKVVASGTPVPGAELAQPRNILSVRTL